MNDRSTLVASRGRAWRRMHECPLVVFSALTIPACGVFAARLVAGLPVGPSPAASWLRALATFSLLAGLAVSLAHLGRPLRAPLAVLRAGRSPLSAETILAVALLGVSLVGLWPALPADLRGMLDAATGVLALALLATLGLVYFLPARWPWHSALVVAPLATGLAAGAATMAAAGEIPARSTALVALLVDALIVVTAWSLRAADAGSVIAVYPPIFARRRSLVVLRLVLVDAAPAFFLLAGVPLAAAIAVIAGVFVDRFTFYGVAAVRSTEAEIACVERMLGAG